MKKTGIRQRQQARPVEPGAISGEKQTMHHHAVAHFPRSLKLCFFILAGLLGAGALYTLSLYNYLLYHSIIELFSVAVAISVFTIGWNTRHIVASNTLLLLAAAYGSVGVLDLLHTLAYSGMGIFPDRGSNLPTQLWIVTRFVESLSLLAAALVIRKSQKLPAGFIFAGYAALTAALLLLIFPPGLFPAMYVEGIGLTSAKVVGEYVICGILLLALYAFWHQRAYYNRHNLYFLMAALAATVASELSFTLYADVYGFFNFLGHLFKLVSFGLIYKALVSGLLKQPYQTLFQDLAQSRDDLQEKQRRLQIAEAELRAIFNNAPSGIILVDEQGIITFANQRMAEMLGCDLPDLVDSAYLDHIYEQEWQEAERNLFKLIRGEIDHVTTERLYRRKNGTIFWGKLVGTQMNYPDGSSRGIAGIITDVTEQKEAEQSLKAAYDKLDKLVELNSDGIMVIDLEGTMLFINPAASQMLGRTRSELIGEQFGYPLTPGENTEIELLSGKGGVKVTELRTSKTEWDGKTSILASFRDITERKQAEEELAEQYALIEAIYSNAPLAMMVVDGNRRLRRVNRFATQFAGSPDEEMLGLRSGEALHCLHALDDPRGCGFGESCRDCLIRNKILETLEDGVTNLQFEASFDFSSEDGSQALTLLVSTTPIPFQGENMALVIIMDITERKQAEKEKEKLQDQLNQAQKMESVGRLAGGVAHDFNNMLTIINGYAEMMADVLSPSDPMYESVGEIQDAGKRAAVVVRKLLAFARKQAIAPAPMDLNDRVSGMLKMLQRLIGENIDLLWNPGKNTWPVKMDHSQIDQILANLVVNARDAISDTGKITIETHNVEFDEQYCADHTGFVPGQFVMLAVSDNGCGMDKHVLDNLFEPFFTTKEIGQGTGLGLPTVYGIVKQNNGFVNVYSEPGQGTSIKIYFPRFSEDTGIPEKREEEQEEALPKGRGETILVLEDETVVMNITRIMLERLGYNIITASLPGKAMEAAKAHNGKIDLLLTDIIMPEMNGREFAEQLKDLFPHIQVLFMSGYTANVIAHHTVLDERLHFIEKPFSNHKLAAKVREVLDF